MPGACRDVARSDSVHASDSRLVSLSHAHRGAVFMRPRNAPGRPEWSFRKVCRAADCQGPEVSAVRDFRGCRMGRYAGWFVRLRLSTRRCIVRSAPGNPDSRSGESNVPAFRDLRWRTGALPNSRIGATRNMQLLYVLKMAVVTNQSRDF